MWNLILLGNQMLPLRVASPHAHPGAAGCSEKKNPVQVNNLQVLIF